MKKYLLLVEDERVWEQFKQHIDTDLNTAIIQLIKSHTEGAHGKKK